MSTIPSCGLSAQDKRGSRFIRGPANAPGLRLLSQKRVLDKLPFGRSRLYELIAANEFPAPLKHGKLNCWPEPVVDDWIEELVASQRDEVAEDGAA